MESEAFEPSVPTRKKPVTRRKLIYSLLVFALSIAGLVNWVVMPIRVAGSSMSPTYESGSIHFLYKLAYHDRPPKRFDVVAIRAPDGDLYLKRIVGLPGEKVAIYGGRVFINGRALKEPDIRPAIPWEITSTQLDADDYYVAGDNRATSVLGAVGRKRILGRVFF